MNQKSKFKGFCADGIRYIRCRRKHEEFSRKCIFPTVKGAGGNVMVWGAFSRAGIDPLHQFVGIKKQSTYMDILNNVLEPYCNDPMPLNWILQQDSDSKHASKLVKK